MIKNEKFLQRLYTMHHATKVPVAPLLCEGRHTPLGMSPPGAEVRTPAMKAHKCVSKIFYKYVRKQE